MQRNLHFSLCLCVFVVFSPAFAASETCEMCHDDPTLEKTVGGIPHSLFVNQAMIDSSVHSGMECTDCHTSLEGFEDFPHPEKLPGVSCAGCHSDAFEVYMSGFHDHLAQKGFLSIPGCVQCHGNHRVSRHPNTQMVCGICHSEQRKQFELSVHNISKDGQGRQNPPLLPPYFVGGEELDGQGSPSSRLRTDKNVYLTGADGGVSCTSCHSAHSKSERGSMLPQDWRSFTIKRCLECHQDQSTDYLSSRHYREVKKGNPRAPICTDCHGVHDLYDVSDPRSRVHIDKLDATCDRCHPGHDATIHRKSGVDPRLMTCVACHTGHHTEMERAGSVIFKETLPNTCNRCHGEDRHAKEHLAHGRIMEMASNGETANCTECHIYHWRLQESARLVEGQGRQVSNPPLLPPFYAGGEEEEPSLRLQCRNCHAQETRDYERSVHGISRRKGHLEAPTCETCHGEKNIERISSRFTGQSIISLCSSCHANRDVTMKFQLNPNVVKGYLSTYHGQMYSLGYQGREFATCTSCHDNHLILPSDNPQSTISQQHIIQTCGRCHEDANVNFVSMLQHYDPMVKEQNIVLTIIHTFMVWLLGITLSVFGIHTLLWLGRAIIDRLRHGRRKVDPAEKKVRYMRFSPAERILHGIVIVSFLMLAATGLPLKYSQSAASQWLAANVIPLGAMAILHRIGAGLTFSYFILHLGMLGNKLARRRISLLHLLWGEDSLAPQPRDFVQFFQHIGWFLGIAEKPRFGRWAYWEKFDYFAVFWGVSIIGLSGLTLWFPEFFTQLLPGWAINAAHIIHSEEALLATGFIFTIHFFNEHLRPENFPFDEVIFTGSIGSHYLKNERLEWYRRLQESGEIEKIAVSPMKPLPRVLLYAFGFLALGVGLALLGLIVAGTFF